MHTNKLEVLYENGMRSEIKSGETSNEYLIGRCITLELDGEVIKFDILDIPPAFFSPQVFSVKTKGEFTHEKRIRLNSYRDEDTYYGLLSCDESINGVRS